MRTVRLANPSRNQTASISQLADTSDCWVLGLGIRALGPDPCHAVAGRGHPNPYIVSSSYEHATSTQSQAEDPKPQSTEGPYTKIARRRSLHARAQCREALASKCDIVLWGFGVSPREGTFKAVERKNSVGSRGFAAPVSVLANLESIGLSGLGGTRS